LGIKKKRGIMVKKAIVVLACVLIASSVFAQATSERTRYNRTTTTVTSVEGVTVTAPPIIQAQEGSAASFQPAGTLVIRTDNANPERFELYGTGLVYDKFGRPVRGPIKPGARVVVFYANDGYTRLVDHIVVLD
jgi:hypothetical protein